MPRVSDLVAAADLLLDWQFLIGGVEVDPLAGADHLRNLVDDPAGHPDEDVEYEHRESLVAKKPAGVMRHDAQARIRVGEVVPGHEAACDEAHGAQYRDGRDLAPSPVHR